MTSRMTTDQFQRFARRMVVAGAVVALACVAALVLSGAQINNNREAIHRTNELRHNVDTLQKAQVEANRRAIRKNKGKVKRLTRIVVGTPGKPGIGVKGSRGVRGGAGAQGKLGPRGEAGPRGVARDGAPGQTGSGGSPGANGKDGTPGKDGANGDQGPKGDQGEPGATGPEPVSFTFVVGAVTYTCTDPELDGSYACQPSP